MVGIDIGSKSIKIVELRKSGANYNLAASGIVGLTGTPIDKLEDERELANLSQIIKKLCKEARISSKEVAFSIPDHLVFTRTIKLPLLNDAEIESAVKWEAEQYIPIPIADAVVQHAVLERREKANPPEVVVLLVAAPKLVVQKWTKVIKTAGLNAVAAETELIALTRALAPQDKNVLLLDFGASSADIAISNHGLLSFSRSIPIAGDAFTRAVSQSLGISAQQAEEYKKTYGLEEKLAEGKIKAVISPIMTMVVDEIKKAIHYYQSEEKGESPTAVIISGGSAGMKGLPVLLTQLLGGMEVLIGNPFSRLAMEPETLKNLLPYAPLYSIAVGLAMIED